MYARVGKVVFIECNLGYEFDCREDALCPGNRMRSAAQE